MKQWIESRKEIMRQASKNVIVFPVERRQNQIEEEREKKRKMKGNDKVISFEAQLESMVRETLLNEHSPDDDGPRAA